jgi:hypothetical protein
MTIPLARMSLTMAFTASIVVSKPLRDGMEGQSLSSGLARWPPPQPEALAVLSTLVQPEGGVEHRDHCHTIGNLGSPDHLQHLVEGKDLPLDELGLIAQPCSRG